MLVESVVVTGAASGIGAAIVEELVESGRTVWAADIQGEPLNSLVDGLQTAEARELDVTDATAVDRVVREAAQGGSMRAVVACAGVSCAGPADEPDPTRWERTFAVNTLGAMYLVRSAIPPMRRAGGGTIVIVASASGRLTYVGEPAYVASKHAIVAFADCVRKELVGTGIRLCVVEPGLVDTPMARSHPAIESIVSAVAPLQPQDIARAVRFALDQPSNCALNEIVIRPTGQDL